MNTKKERFGGTSGRGKPYKQILTTPVHLLDVATDGAFAKCFGRLTSQNFGVSDNDFGDAPTGHGSRQATPHGFDFR